MKEFLLTQISNPQNWALAVILLIQLWKWFKPSLSPAIQADLAKVEGFLGWAVPSIFQMVEGLEKSGAINKSSKLGIFLDLLTKKAAEQKINLTGENLLAAKTITEGLAQATKTPLANPLPLPVSK